MLKENEALWNRLEKYLRAEGIGEARIRKYQIIFKFLDDYIKKPLNQVTKDDVVGFVSDVIQKRYSTAESRNAHKRVVKRIFKLLEKEDVVSWIKKEREKNKILEVLSEEEIKRMIKVAGNPRDRAIISVLYESGCRISEFLNMKWGDVVYDDMGARIKVSGKTGERWVRIIFSVPYLRAWQSEHSKPKPENYIWLARFNHHEKPLRPQVLNRILKEIGKKARIRKKIHAHLFRHSRATHLARHLKESELRLFFGWSKDSDMPARYIHLASKDLDQSIGKIYGLVEEEKESQKLSVKICWRCKESNKVTDSFCVRCGAKLDIDEKMFRAMILKEELLKREDVRKIVENVLYETLKKLIEERSELKELVLRAKSHSNK